MARIRTVKPEYWTDDRVGECSVSARLLFIATWNFADDHGGLDRSAKQLKAQAFPYDNIDCESLVQELLNARLLVEYEAGGKKYLHIRNFRLHQKVEKPAKPRVPVYEDSLKTPRAIPESSPTSSGSSLGMEGNGREGKEEHTAATPPRVRKRVPRGTTEPDPDWMLDFKLAYPNRGGDPEWRSAIKQGRARIAEGHTPEEFIAGAKRYAAYCEAAGYVGTQYVKQASTFLGPAKDSDEKHFLKPWVPPAVSTGPPPPVRTWRPTEKDSGPC